jgi:hypothetical protein
MSWRHVRREDSSWPHDTCKTDGTRNGINALAGSPAWPLDKSRNPACPLDKSRNWNAKAEIFDWLAELSRLYYTVEQSNDRKSSRLAAAFVDTSEGARPCHVWAWECKDKQRTSASRSKKMQPAQIKGWRDHCSTMMNFKSLLHFHMKCGMVRQCILLANDSH